MIPRFLAAAVCSSLPWLVMAQAPTQKATLLNVSKGQVPGDTGMDDKTVPEIVADAKGELTGGKMLKIAFAAGDSFGSKTGANSNWKRFAFFRCDALAKEPVVLELTVVHARSSSYQTRVVMPIKLKAGKNQVKIGIDEMTNVNGSAPDLGKVVKWYILDVAHKVAVGVFWRHLAGGWRGGRRLRSLRPHGASRRLPDQRQGWQSGRRTLGNSKYAGRCLGRGCSCRRNLW